MTTLALIPGWGLDAALWRPLQTLLPDSVVIDMHAPQLPDRPLVAVGHSLGFTWALRQPVAWTAMVSVGGFARFTTAADFPHGTPPRLLERMRTRFAEEPETVHRDFVERALGPRVFRPADLDAGLKTRGPEMGDGLRWLAEWDEREALALLDVPLLALAAEDDQIVPPAMTRAVFPDAIFCPDGGHLLPLTRPDWCAARIREFLP